MDGLNEWSVQLGQQPKQPKAKCTKYLSTQYNSPAGAVHPVDNELLGCGAVAVVDLHGGAARVAAPPHVHALASSILDGVGAIPCQTQRIIGQCQRLTVSVS